MEAFTILVIKEVKFMRKVMGAVLSLMVVFSAASVLSNGLADDISPDICNVHKCYIYPTPY